MPKDSVIKIEYANKRISPRRYLLNGEYVTISKFRPYIKWKWYRSSELVMIETYYLFILSQPGLNVNADAEMTLNSLA